MVATIRLVPASGVWLDTDVDTLHVSWTGATLDAVSVVRIVRPHTTGGVWTSSITTIDPNDALELTRAPIFDSFESLAKAAPDALRWGGQGNRLFASVRAAGPVPKTRIHDILATLLQDSELVVGVGSDNAT